MSNLFVLKETITLYKYVLRLKKHYVVPGLRYIAVHQLQTIIKRGTDGQIDRLTDSRQDRKDRTREEQECPNL